MINITVKTLDSQNRNFTVEDDITVKQFKEHIAPSVNITADIQRMIYCGRVLQDDKKLSEYGKYTSFYLGNDEKGKFNQPYFYIKYVNNKVIHLVERAPPQPGGRSRSPPPNYNNSGTATFRSRRYFGNTGHPIYLGSMSINTPDFMYTASEQPPQQMPLLPFSRTLSNSRLQIARKMLRLANRYLNRLENNTDPPSESSPTAGSSNQQNDEQASSNVASNVDNSADIDDLLDTTTPGFAAQVSMPHSAYASTPLQNLFSLAERDIENAAMASMIQIPNENNQMGGNADIDPLSEQQSTSSSTNDPNQPTDTPSNNQSQSESSTENSTNSRSVPIISRTIRLSELLDEMARVHARLAPFMSRYLELMREDPQFSNDTEVQQAQRTFDLVSATMHAIGHAYHALSDLICQFSQSAPRALLCRPTMVPHTVLQAGISLPVRVRAQVEIEDRRRRNGRSGTNSSSNNQRSSEFSTGTPTNATTPTTGENNENGPRRNNDAENNRASSTAPNMESSDINMENVEIVSILEYEDDAMNRNDNEERASSMNDEHNEPSIYNENWEDIDEDDSSSASSRRNGSRPGSRRHRANPNENQSPPNGSQTTNRSSGSQTEQQQPQRSSTRRRGRNNRNRHRSPRGTGGTFGSLNDVDILFAMSPNDADIDQDGVSNQDLIENLVHVVANSVMRSVNLTNDATTNASNTTSSTITTTSASVQTTPSTQTTPSAQAATNTTDSSASATNDGRQNRNLQSIIEESRTILDNIQNHIHTHLPEFTISDSYSASLQRVPGGLEASVSNISSSITNTNPSPSQISISVVMPPEIVMPNNTYRHRHVHTTTSRATTSDANIQTMPAGGAVETPSTGTTTQSSGAQTTRNGTSATTTQTPRTPGGIRPHVHVQPHSFRGFDPFLQCNSHHIRRWLSNSSGSNNNNNNTNTNANRSHRHIFVPLSSALANDTPIATSGQRQNETNNESSSATATQSSESSGSTSFAGFSRRSTTVPTSMEVDTFYDAAETPDDNSVDMQRANNRGENRKEKALLPPASTEQHEGNELPTNIPSEPWHSTVPPEWISVVTRDIQTQREQPPQQPPYSDAYLSSVPAKRRKLIKRQKPNGDTVPEVISNTLQDAIASAGLTHVAPVTQVTRAAASDNSLQAAYRDELRERIRNRPTNGLPPQLAPIRRFPNSSQIFFQDE